MGAVSKDGDAKAAVPSRGKRGAAGACGPAAPGRRRGRVNRWLAAMREAMFNIQL